MSYYHWMILKIYGCSNLPNDEFFRCWEEKENGFSRSQRTQSGMMFFGEGAPTRITKLIQLLNCHRSSFCSMLWEAHVFCGSGKEWSERAGITVSPPGLPVSRCRNWGDRKWRCQCAPEIRLRKRLLHWERDRFMWCCGADIERTW